MGMVGVLALAGCGPRAEEEPSQGGAGTDSSASAAGVGYIEIQPTALSRIERLPGRVVAYQLAEIRPQVSGIIEARLFEEGSYVEEGEPLYQIDPALYQADVELAQANLRDAEARLANARRLAERSEELIEADAISQQQYDDAIFARDQAEATASRAEAELARAKINLDYTEVRSPLSGFIGPTGVTKGALVTAQQAMSLATVRQLDPVYVDLSQAAAETRDLQQRLTAAQEEDGEARFEVTLYLETDGDPYPHRGRLDATDAVVDRQTGAIRLRSVFPNPDRALLPGMFVRASIEDLEEGETILIPQKSVRLGPTGDKRVWLIGPEDKVRQQTIRTAGTFENNWIVEEGLQSGDRLVVEGTMGLEDDAAVEPEKIEAPNISQGEG